MAGRPDSGCNGRGQEQIADWVLSRAATILLVEDEEIIRVNFARYLRKLGYEVLEAKDGQAALECIAQEGTRIDLLVTDVVMPRLGGLMVATRLREEHPDKKVIFMSGYPGGSHDALSTYGPLLRKPFDAATLAQAIQAALGPM